MKKFIFIFLSCFFLASCVFNTRKKDANDGGISLKSAGPEDSSNSKPTPTLQPVDKEKEGIGTKAEKKVILSPNLDTIAVH